MESILSNLSIRLVEVGRIVAIFARSAGLFDPTPLLDVPPVNNSTALLLLLLLLLGESRSQLAVAADV